MKKLFSVTVNYASDFFGQQALAQSGPGGGANSGITNPLGENMTIQDFIINAIQFLLGLSALLAFAAIVYGGIRLVASFGSEQSVQTGKNIIKWAVVGMIVIMLSYLILITTVRFLGINI